MGTRLIRTAVVACMIAAGVGALTPVAQASDCEGGSYADPKDPGRPVPQDYGFITGSGLHVTVNPSGARPYLTALAEYYAGAADFAICVSGAEQYVACALAAVDKAGEIAGSLQPEQLNFRYVYLDSEGAVHVAGDQAASDAQVVTCFLQ